MSNTLKDAATSTLHAVSHLVDDAQAHLEHLPLVHRTAPWWRSKWTISTAAGVLVLATVGWMLRRRGAQRRAATLTEPTATDVASREAARAASALVDYDMVRS